jgi:hypothetical protein
MSSIRCKNCGLTNFVEAIVCKRCGIPLRTPEKPKPPVRFSFYALLAFAVVGLIVYYSIGGLESSFDQVNATESNQQALQHKENPAGLSRTEYDRQRSNQYGGAVRNSNSLSETQKHNEDLQKAMQTQ